MVCADKKLMKEAGELSLPELPRIVFGGAVIARIVVEPLFDADNGDCTLNVVVDVTEPVAPAPPPVLMIVEKKVSGNSDPLHHGTSTQKCGSRLWYSYTPLSRTLVLTGMCLSES